jgi:hypothetical protein
MMAHPGWLQLLHARPGDMHLSVHMRQVEAAKLGADWRRAARQNFNFFPLSFSSASV